ncbi:hypothetical protein SBOR_6973 [Sclerotinia borealis F-4128]|uniref:Uncharacterized protein n=1 Tax=Sclerotinia borealis (strain F-4128) TaxID=1432307 RepID=W9CCS9_SCLBF|nr:hypothetical protein SBOR_6973 [Sclerotinia borealis F-4128]
MTLILPVETRNQKIEKAPRRELKKARLIESSDGDSDIEAEPRQRSKRQRVVRIHSEDFQKEKSRGFPVSYKGKGYSNVTENSVPMPGSITMDISRKFTDIDERFAQRIKEQKEVTEWFTNLVVSIENKLDSQK